MATQSVSQFAHPQINAYALLGLYDPVDSTNWGPIRAAQLTSGRKLAPVQLCANVICTLLMAAIGFGRMPWWMIAGWGALVIAISLGIFARRWMSRRKTAADASFADVRGTLGEGIVLGLAWSLAPIALIQRADPVAAVGVLAVLMVLATASAVAMAALPLAAMGFVGVIGIVAAVMVFVISGPIAATALAWCALLAMFVVFDRARALVSARASEIALAERDETVALLLRDTNSDHEAHDADWLWETDANRRVVRASPRFAYALGLDPLAIDRQPFLQILAGPAWTSGELPAGLNTLSERLKGRETFRGLVLELSIKGERRFWELSASPRFDDNGAFIGFRGVGSDVTAARESADKINRMARFDPLTSLPNRLLLHETLAQAMAEAEKWGSRCAFMMIDLDRFKAVNDTLGHPVGDRLLGRVAERLSQLMSENEMCGRLGGDEFAVVMRDASDLSRLEKLAYAIIETVSRPYDVDQHTLFIGASVGVAIGPRDGRTAETLVRSADLALYRSKDAGGGAFHIYEPKLHLQAEERRVLEIALRSALRNGQFHLNYQPVVAADSGTLMGFEALLRWDHPEMGPISPARFVPLAEDARLIRPMGEWALRTACAEAATWPGNFTVAVNVSAEQLSSPDFVTVVASALANSGLPAERLEIEVTESVFVRESTGALHVLQKISDMGVKLSLDDFGTGYSSLGYLLRTRFSTIKVDRGFVTAAAKGKPEAIAIIRAVVALAQSLGMATTAEGVETEEEQEMVQRFGCSKVQGYYFGRPLPVEEARAVVLRSAASAQAA